MFIGNIPAGTRFIGEALAVGVYWENAQGASDIDLSGIGASGKVGWNADYFGHEGGLMYSGDITSAPDGAVEYLYASRGLEEPILVQANVYMGEPDCRYKIIVGAGDRVDYDYMMDPNNLLLEAEFQSVQEQSILGLFAPVDDRSQGFTLLGMGAGHTRVSGYGELCELSTRALVEQWSSVFTLNELFEMMGTERAASPGEADIDLSLGALQKDTFIRLFG
jgi:hypothetical protein